MALAGLRKKLSDDQVVSKISPRDLHDIANSALDRIGLGPKGPDIVLQTNIQNNTTSVTVDASALQRAQARLRQNEAVLLNGSEPPRSGSAPLQVAGSSAGPAGAHVPPSITESVVVESATVRPRSAVALEEMLREFESDACIVLDPVPAGAGSDGEGEE